VSGHERLFRWLSGLLLAAVLGLLFASSGDYGVSSGEPAQNRYGNRVVRWYQTLGGDRSAVEQNDLRYEGGLFELAVHAALRVSPLDLYRTRHLVGASFAFVGLLAAWWMGSLLGGASGGFLAALILAATPPFFGAAFADGAHVAFASLFALASAALLSLGIDRLPGPGWRVLVRLLSAGTAVGLAAGVHVAALCLLGFAALAWLLDLWATRSGRPFPSRTLGEDLGRVALDVAIVSSTAWLLMVLCWPWAQLDPFGNPLEAVQAAGRGAEVVFFAGALTTAGQLPRLHAPWLLALTLPASYFVAGVLGAWRVALVLRHKPLPAETWTKLSSFGWLLSVCLLPLLWTVLSGIPVPDRSSLLFVVPALAALAGASATWWLRSPLPAPVRVVGGLLLAAALGVAATDMLALHPYESVYFNRLLAGGLARAGRLYETDQSGASYAEGLRWVAHEYARTRSGERVRVAAATDRAQLTYYLGSSDELRRRFEVVSLEQDPQLVLASTSRREDERTPGRVVHVVERQGWPLLKVFELRPPQP
jgi:hypothetical protein